MNVHEYQAKGLFKDFGIPVPQGHLCRSVEDVRRAYAALGGGTVVVKAQIHAGGRGKAGGVKIARSADEAASHAKALLGKALVTHQTGPEGRRVTKLLVEEGLAIKKEFYAALAVDRRRGGPVMIASAEGGVEIESVPQEKLLKEPVDVHEGLRAFQSRTLAYGLGLTGDAAKQGAEVLRNLARLFVEKDCSLAEINPLVLLEDGRVLALDAKVNFDDNALFRHPDAAALRDPEEEDPAEARAKEYDLSYVSLDGTIGCMVNGAGLAMATMDIIQHAGGKPANFLDVGGGASKERVTAAFKIILADEAVRAILVNIFGGIVKCDLIAEGILEAVKEVQLKVPLVVRLEGTNVERGRQLLKASGLKITAATDMADAAKKAVEAAR
ncbi:MAG TPA: ADP-forming succinate--CoA ligase subunit beta [Planctomycetota bacterium]|nr:ADP-forming succinate--CoA ligase subunit beta [Planctomycetota bacterium]